MRVGANHALLRAISSSTSIRSLPRERLRARTRSLVRRGMSHESVAVTTPVFQPVRRKRIPTRAGADAPPVRAAVPTLRPIGPWLGQDCPMPGDAEKAPAPTEGPPSRTARQSDDTTGET